MGLETRCVAGAPFHEPRSYLRPHLKGLRTDGRPQPCQNLRGVIIKRRDGSFDNSRRQTTPTRMHHGNPAALFALDAARELLAREPRAVCIVGGIDSLLGEELLERLEEDERLKSEGYDNPHGMSPGEAVGLLAVEGVMDDPAPAEADLGAPGGVPAGIVGPDNRDS